MFNQPANLATLAQPQQYDLPGELSKAAHHLGRAITSYNAQSAAQDCSSETRVLVHAFHRVLSLALPCAPVDLLESMIELCAMETARARLEHQADDGTLPGARILDLGQEAY
jgi:hypothetical protein